MDVSSTSAQLLFSTVMVERGSGGSGTAFFFKHTWDGGDALFLVTNKHVVEGADFGRFWVTLGDGEEPLIGQRTLIELDDFQSRWYGHKCEDVDVTIMLFASELERSGKQVFFRAVTSDLIPTVAQINELFPLEDVLFIGYPIGLFDEKNLMPVARRGMTATPVQLDYNDKPIFLIDASVFPGSSGSPVFIHNPAGFASKNSFTVSSRLYFLGVLSQGYLLDEDGRFEVVSIPTGQAVGVKTRQMIDLGIVFKSSVVLEVVQDFLRDKKLI